MLFKTLSHMALGAFVWWVWYGNPTVVSAIPFAAMMFFWPLFLIWKFIVWAAFWVLVIFLTIFVLGGAYLGYDHWKVSRDRDARLRRANERQT